MKLIYRILRRISLILLLIMAAWATLFYFIIIDEINDETDDMLEDFSEQIITHALAGLPAKDNNTNNTYYITEVSPAYAAQHENIRYFEEEVYIESKKETEPARTLKTIFRNTENTYHELTVSTPTIEKEDLQETILLWIIFLYVLLLLVIISINHWILYRSFKPLYSLLKWLDHYSIDKGIRPLENRTNVSEFRKLNEAVMLSAKRNVEIYEQQKEFIGNTSHELQTPLAVCKNRLELLIDDDDLSEKQLEEIIKTQQTLDHIIKLNKTLLLLTKIENNQFPDQKEVHINSLIRQLTEDYTEVYAHLGIHTTVADDIPIYIYMNETLARVLLNNLIKNAFLHNHRDGRIEIRTDASGVYINNTGNPAPLEVEHIFKRFYRGERKEGSVGLGLALTESICKLYGFRLSYEYAEGLHKFCLKKK